MDKATEALLAVMGIFIGIPAALVSVGVLIGWWIWG